MNEFLILFILKIKDSNIYEIKKFIDKNLAPFMQISTGAILPALNRLEKQELIKSEKAISKGGLKKSIYKIQPKGEERFNSFLSQPIVGAPQIARREIEVLSALLGHEIFTEDQNVLLQEKISNALQDNISLLKKTLTLKALNQQYFELELEYTKKKLNSILNSAQ